MRHLTSLSLQAVHASTGMTAFVTPSQFATSLLQMKQLRKLHISNLHMQCDLPEHFRHSVEDAPKRYAHSVKGVVKLAEAMGPGRHGLPSLTCVDVELPVKLQQHVMPELLARLQALQGVDQLPLRMHLTECQAWDVISSLGMADSVISSQLVIMGQVEDS
jgi:hypothetical protein